MLAAEQPVSERGGADRVELSNGPVRVVLDPGRGGRVLVYALEGRNVIYVDPAQDDLPAGTGLGPTGGRCDIGPEMTTPAHPLLWSGPWQVTEATAREATLVSAACPETGLQLERRFTLDELSAHLRFTQRITNVSETARRACHWGRTFVPGGGIALVPLNPASRFPRGYLLYGPGDVMDYRPAEHPAVRNEQGVLVIAGAQDRAKYAVDSVAGWLAYLSPNDCLFVKTFAVLPGRVYGEMAAATASIWYHGKTVCEMEPIGPLEVLEPGGSASFTEHWWLFAHRFPADGQVNVAALRERIERWL